MPIETQAAPSARARDQSGSGWPGLIGGVLSAAAAALLLWAWALPQLDQPAGDTVAAASSVLAEVAPAEIEAAVRSLGLSPSLATQLKQQDQTCGGHLAFLTAARAPGATDVSIRIKSGRWYSPAYKLGDAPVRIAVPFPAPYAAGHGTLEIMRDGGGATISLNPVLHLTGAGGVAARDVSWIPDRACPAEGAP